MKSIAIPFHVAVRAVLAALVAGAAFVLVVPGIGAARNGPPDPVHGKQVFDEFCSACHNKLEKVGSYLVDDTAYFVKAGVPREAMGSLLRHPVRERPPGSRMPAFTPEEISDADLDDLGMYLAGQTPLPKTPPRMGSAERGASLYAEHCAACHGARGEGVNKMLPVAMFAHQLKTAKVPPSVMLGFVHLAARSGSVPNMPTFAVEMLDDQALADIAAHIWAMPAPEPPTAMK